MRLPHPGRLEYGLVPHLCKFWEVLSLLLSDSPPLCSKPLFLSWEDQFYFSHWCFSLTLLCAGENFCLFILLGTHWASWIWDLVSAINSEKSLVCLFAYHLYPIPSLCAVSFQLLFIFHLFLTRWWNLGHFLKSVLQISCVITSAPIQSLNFYVTHPLVVLIMVFFISGSFIWLSTQCVSFCYFIL